jgi:hypothetical protein
MSGPGQRSWLSRIASALRAGWSDKRQMLGLVALGMLLAGGTIAIAGWVASTAAALSGPLFRAGLVLGAVWLAWPQINKLISRIPQYFAVGLGILLLIGVIKPRVLFIAVPIALLLWFFGPLLARRFTGGPAMPPGRTQVRSRRQERK